MKTVNRYFVNVNAIPLATSDSFMTTQNKNTTNINSQLNTQIMSLKCVLYALNLENKQPYSGSKWSTLQGSCIKVTLPSPTSYLKV